MVAEENNRIVGGGLLLKGVIEEVNCASFFKVITWKVKEKRYGRKGMLQIREQLINGNDQAQLSEELMLIGLNFKLFWI